MVVLLVAGLVGGPLLLLAILAIVDSGSQPDFPTVFVTSTVANGLTWGLHRVAADRLGQAGIAAGSVVIACLLISWWCNTTFLRAVIAGLVYGVVVTIALGALLPGAAVDAPASRPLALRAPVSEAVQARLPPRVRLAARGG